MAIPGVPPEVAKEAEAVAEALWKILAEDMPDAVDLSVVKPRVMTALVLAFCQGALVVTQRGVETLAQIQRGARVSRGN